MATVLNFRPPQSNGGGTIGLDVAIGGLNQAWQAYSSASPLGCLTDFDQDFERFEKDTTTLRTDTEVRRVLWQEADSWQGYSGLLRPDPALSSLAWLRRRFDQRALSLIGVVHTMSSAEVMEAVGNLMAAPIQPWDALICPSEAIQDVVKSLLEASAAFLAERTGGAPPTLPQLPVIPLGINTADFPGVRDTAERARIRKEMALEEGDILVLYYGRLSYYSKGNPYPLLAAAERVARKTKKRVAVAFNGFFELPSIETAIREAAEDFAPSVTKYYIPNDDPRFPAGLWAAADIFTSLADNIQESFGITPIEAMASGLPALVSDWDGYRVSVRDEVDGFRIPVTAPGPGMGSDLAERYHDGRDVYGEYIGGAAHGGAVDVDATATALERLVLDGDLRRKMGAAGRKRAEEVFDWKAVIPRYEALTDDLAELRAQAAESVPRAEGKPAHPLRPDPYTLFSTFPTRTLTREDRVVLAVTSQEEVIDRLDHKACLFYEPAVADRRQAMLLLGFLGPRGEVSLAELEQALPTFGQQTLHRTVAHWLKLGILRLV